LNATLNERQRLTSELHDEAAQTLSLLNLKVGELDDLLSDREHEMVSVELEQFKQLTERAQAQMRMAFSGMNTVSIAGKNNDIRKELDNYITEFRNANGITVELVIGDLSSLVIPALIQKQAMYIYREALTNVRRYANAKKVQVQLEEVGGGIQLLISDDGRGFDPNLTKSDHHLGLAVMQARMERVGGTLSIETAPGAGTRVTASIPIAAGTPAILNEMT
jgi:signal transduction histidine kinase